MTDSLPLLFSPAAFLEYQEQCISDFGSGMTTVPFLEMKRLLMFCELPDLLYSLEEQEEFDEGIEIHSVIWEGLVLIARRNLRL